MRASGVLLLVLVFGHLFVNLMLGKGIHAIDFAFVAGKWANPFWQVWDLAMLWLAELHGMNGLRTIINDYATKQQTRFWLKTALYFSAFVVLVLGTLVIFTFDPCIGPSSTLDVCRNN
jgi:succinate dehydrogenase / fumarate reductase membrane anchor subunit